MAKLRPYVPPPVDTMIGRSVLYRTSRGGSIPLTRKQCEQLLTLYDEYRRPVSEIAAIFGLKTHTVYRILPLLGVRPRG